MKKIFKIASLLLLSGSVALFTSCTKDYGTEVSELNQKVESLTTSFADQSTQIKTLQNLVGKLEAIYGKIAQKADSADVAELQKSVKTLEGEISSLKDNLSKKADASWVEQTYATITWVKEIENNLGSLSAAVDSIKNFDIPSIKKDITAAADSAAKALGEIETIKGWFKNYYTISEVDQKLSVLKEVDSTILDEVAKLQKKDEELKELIDKQDGLINDLIANKADTKDLENLEKKLQAEIDAKTDTSTVNALQKQLDAVASALNLGKADTSTVYKLQRQLEDLQKEVDESIKPDIEELFAKINLLSAKLDALAARVTSLSVCPTVNEEIIAFKYGEDAAKKVVARMMRVTIAVTPSDAIDYICEHKDSLHLIYAEGYQRTTKANVDYKEANILDVKKEDNTIVILANKIDIEGLATERKTGIFFAAGWGDVDNAGKTRVISDFAQAIEGEFDFTLNYFKYAYRSKSDTTNNKIQFVYLDSLATESSYDYNQAATAKEKPFTDYFVAYDNSSVNVPEDVKLMLPKGCYTLYQLSQLLDYPFVATTKILKDESYPAQEVEQNKGFETEFQFVPEAPKGLNDYVRDNPWTVSLQGVVNNVDVSDTSSSQQVKHRFYITPLDKGQFDLGTVRVYWNWKTYYAKDRKAVYDPATNRDVSESAKAAWRAAYEAKCKVTEKLGNGSSAGLEYANWDENDSTSSYYPSITLSLLDSYDSTKAFENVKDIIKKQNDTVMYKFGFETIVDTPCQDQTVNFSTTVRGSVTLADTIAVPNFLSSVLAEKPGDEHKVKSIFVSGLSGTDATWTNIYEAAKERMRVNDNCTVVDDSTGISYQIKHAASSQLVEKDTLYFIVPAGTWGYNETRNVTCTVKDLFGFKYEVKVAVKTGAPQFGLQTKNWIDPTTKIGTAIGKLVAGVYTLDSMYYNKQVEIKGLNNLLTSENVSDEDVVVKFNIDDTKYSGIGNEAGKNGITVSLADGSLGNKILTWGTYNGLEFDVTATLYVKEKEISGSAVTYTIETKKPVRYVSHADYTATRTAATNLPIKIWEHAVAYGVVENQEVATNIVSSANGTISKYKDTYFEYDAPSQWTVKLNGSTPTSWVSGVDYMWSCGSKGEEPTLTIMGDNLQGKLEITIKSKLHSYLDGGEPEEKDIHITVNQN